MTDRDPRARFLAAIRGELRGWPLRRRRLLRELAEHLDDTVAELRAAGHSEQAAIDEALERLGDADTIATACRNVRAQRPRFLRGGSLRSPAWVAVGAMGLVTAWAAELPQASGAKVTTNPVTRVHRHSAATAARRDHRARSNRGAGIGRGQRERG